MYSELRNLKAMLSESYVALADTNNKPMENQGLKDELLVALMEGGPLRYHATTASDVDRQRSGINKWT